MKDKDKMMDKKTLEKIMDILTRYGNFMDGYDADGDELDIDETFRAIRKLLKARLKVLVIAG